MSHIKNFAELRQAALQKIGGRKIPRLGALSPMKKHLEALREANKLGLVTPILYGRAELIKKIAAEAKIEIAPFDIVDTEIPLQDAVAHAREKKLDILFNGGITVRDVARYIVKKDAQFIPDGKTASHVALLSHHRYHKMMFVTDAAVIPSPDAAQKIALVENAATVARTCGIPVPKAALLAAVEAIYPAVPVTMEEAAIAKMGDRGQIKNVVIDGPLSFDCAISAEVAAQKGIKNSPVAGDPDIFMAPTMETANGIYKGMVMYAKAEGAGVIFGGTVPIASGFEIDSVENIINSIALGVLLA